MFPGNMFPRCFFYFFYFLFFFLPWNGILLQINIPENNDVTIIRTCVLQHCQKALSGLRRQKFSPL